MRDWKKRLYASYVSTGQSATNVDSSAGLSLNHYPYFFRLIKRHVPLNPDVSILDLGCGHGALIFCLKKQGYRDVQGIDLSREQVDLAHQLGLTGIECQDALSFLTDKIGTFDVVFLMDVLEHLDKSELLETLDQVRTSLRSGGRAIIHVPNGQGIFGMRVRYGDLTHETCFTPESAAQVLRTCGFQNIQCFEDAPVVYGLKSLFRRLLWILFTVPFRLLLMAETGIKRQVLSQSMLVIATKGE